MSEQRNDEGVGERLARIETKLDSALGRLDDHEPRIRKLERIVWIGAGLAGAAGGYLGQLLPVGT